jgi:hypothetical protein
MQMPVAPTVMFYEEVDEQKAEAYKQIDENKEEK